MLVVSRARCFRCFGCGEDGDVIDFAFRLELSAQRKPLAF
ncbi:CHC2 zinc finger domain-containing protein [Intestinimonas timonensis]